MRHFVLLLLPVIATHLFAIDIWQRPEAIAHPDDNRPTPERIALGKLLFFDKRLSRNDDISCATCHRPEQAWTDGKTVATGTAGRKGRRNTPTLVNAAHQQSYFWDGRSESLEAQALEPIIATHEMDLPAEAMAAKLGAIEGYRTYFDSAYPKEGITPRTVAKAIAAFERTIISNDTPYDRWLRNHDDAELSAEAIEGMNLFVQKAKCKSCHGGFNFTFGNFEDIGLGSPDHGVYELSKNPVWYNAFKTPTLREVEKTAPYFHDGSVPTLEESVTICGNGGRQGYGGRSPFFKDRSITPEEAKKIVAFLKTLTSPTPPVEAPESFPQ